MVAFETSGEVLAQSQTRYDVCVYGGTSSGVIAAVQANRMGKSVILISPTKNLGGLSSGGLGFTDMGDPSSGLLPRVNSNAGGENGDSDKRVQAIATACA